MTKQMGSGIVRDIEFDGMPLKERYFFYPKEKVQFIRVAFGDEMKTTWNEILEIENRKLLLRFAFEI